jgi:hypothetical protein
MMNDTHGIIIINIGTPQIYHCENKSYQTKKIKK